jgi:hypothetical protein
MTSHRTVFRAAFAAVLIVAAAAFVMQASPARAGSSYELRNVLGTLRTLSDSSFAEVVSWVRSGNSAPNYAMNQAQSAERQVSALGYSDREAVRSWLRGNGRSALYVRGANDVEIGPRRPGADYNAAPEATPNPYRHLPLTTNSLDGSADAQGDVQILGGFAAARKDGRSVIACVSFKNTSPKTATRIVLSFPLLDANGNHDGTLHLNRTGTFSTGIDIMTYQNFASWGGGTGFNNKGYASNCASATPNLVSQQILRAHSVGYQVDRVEYSDGSFWTPSSSSP